MVKKIEALAKKLYSNVVVERTIHTAWQAALGATVAAYSGTHGDVRGALMVGVAAAAAAVKNALLAKNANNVSGGSDLTPAVVDSPPAAATPTNTAS